MIESMKKKIARAGLTVTLPDGYTGATRIFYATPIERDGALVKLMCAESGKDYLIRWALDVDVIKALAETERGGEMSHSNKGIFAMRRSDFEATLRKACDDAVKYLDEHRSENSQGIDAATIYEIIIRKLEEHS